MSGKLATHVWVQSEEGSGWFGPDDDVPSWAAEAITNPAAWAAEDGGVVSGDGPPPKSGKGSGIGAWTQYAAAHGIEVPEGTSKDDVIAALESASVPTESE